MVGGTVSFTDFPSDSSCWDLKVEVLVFPVSMFYHSVIPWGICEGSS